MLRPLFPETVAGLDELSAEHALLDAGLTTLSTAVEALAATSRLTGTDAHAAAVGIAATQHCPPPKKCATS